MTIHQSRNMYFDYVFIIDFHAHGSGFVDTIDGMKKL